MMKRQQVRSYIRAVAFSIAVPASILVGGCAAADGTEVEFFARDLLLNAVAAFVLNECFGLDQGFESYASPHRGDARVSTTIPQIPAGAMVDRALADIAELAAGDAPFFYWLHLYDPHGPHGGSGDGRTAPLRGRYLAEVSYTDGELARLVAGLRELEVWEELALVFMADHGEGLDDGREMTHGYFVYEETMRIPLFLRCPGLEPARVRGVVSLVDVVPTVLALLEVPSLPDRYDGIDLAEAARTGAAPARAVGIEAYLPLVSHGWAPFEGVVRGRHKLVRSRERELYDLLVDPLEQNNVYREDGAVGRELFGELERLFAPSPRALERETVTLDQRDRDALVALGYSGSTDGGIADRAVDFGGLADTYAKYPLAVRFWEVTDLVKAGQVDQAIGELRLLVKDDAGNGYVMTNLADLLMQNPGAAGRNVVEAEALLLPALAQRPEDTMIHWVLARCAKVRADGFEQELRVASELRDDAAVRRAADGQREQMLRFQRELRQVIELEPTHTAALGILAVALYEESAAALAANRPAVARGHLAEAIALIDRMTPLLSEADPKRAQFHRLRGQLRQSLAGLGG